MKKHIAVLIAFIFLVSGCSLFKKEPQKAVNDGFSGMNEVEKSQSSFVIKGTVQPETGATKKSLQFTLQADGKTDSSKDDALKIDMKFKLSAMVGTSTGSGEVAVKIVDKKAYVNMTALNLPGIAGTELKKELESVLNAWWILPSGESNPFGKLTEDQKKLKEQFKTANFFINAVEDGQEVIQGISTTRFRVDLDKEAAKNFIVSVARSGQNQIQPDEEAAIAESLKDVEFSGAVWVGDDDMIHRIRGTVTSRPTEGASGSYDLDYTSWDYGKDFTVEAPTNAKEFNMMLLAPILSIFEGMQANEDTGSTTSPAAKMK